MSNTRNHLFIIFKICFDMLGVVIESKSNGDTSQIQCDFKNFKNHVKF
jgi:hypothetical protein